MKSCKRSGAYSEGRLPTRAAGECDGTTHEVAPYLAKSR
jgi:hypothetical protein